MTNIVMICKDRPRLTEQTLRTLYDTVMSNQFNLTIMDDFSGPETFKVIERYGTRSNSVYATPSDHAINCVGALKNAGASVSEQAFGRGDWLCFIDNDIAFFDGWLNKMSLSAYTETIDGGPIHSIIGGYRHPYHAVNSRIGNVFEFTDAVAGYMHFMSWSTWGKFGPYDANAKGVCQSEDFAICQRVSAAGGIVGYVHPPVIANCGLTNTEGKHAIGSELFPRIPGLIYE
jgi:glycosyltransferase involved in cell wall biosynthesis